MEKEEYHQYKGRTLQSIRNEIAYEKLSKWKKFLHGWSACGWSWKYPINYYKLWRLIKK